MQRCRNARYRNSGSATSLCSRNSVQVIVILIRVESRGRVQEYENSESESRTLVYRVLGRERVRASRSRFLGDRYASLGCCWPQSHTIDELLHCARASRER